MKTPAHYSAAASNQELLENIENLVLSWIKQIEQVLAQSEQASNLNKHKKWSFPSRVSSIIRNKSAVVCGIAHFHKRNFHFQEKKPHFLCNGKIQYLVLIKVFVPYIYLSVCFGEE